MISVKEFEEFRKSCECNKEKERENVLTEFWNEVTKTEARFEKIVDDGIRRRIQANKESNEKLNFLIVNFQVERLTQVAALSRIIKKYSKLSGLKIDVAEETTYVPSCQKYDNEFRNYFDLFFGGHKTKYEISSMTVDELQKKCNELVKSFTSVDDYNLSLGTVETFLPDEGYTEKEITVKDILQNTSLTMIKGNSRIVTNRLLQFSI
jgi:hypothetical protein